MEDNMKISQIIKEKRKHLGLTQENIAEYLGVSIPAVSKWENGTTYPDITLLPGLARLLKTDLNTLMSFNEEMSEVEIKNVVMKVQSIIQEDGFEDGFQFALDQVRAFPTCENLIYSLGVFLQPSLGLQSVEHQSKYREELAKLYFRIRNSENIEIKKEAISFLFYLHCEKEEYGVPLCPTFLYSIMVGEYVWFIPYTTNKIIYINKKNYKLYSFEIEDENETRDTLLANLLHHKYLLEYVKDNRFIGLYSLKNNRILEIDAKELNYKWKDYTFSDKSLTQCCEINNNKLCREGDSLERLVYCKKIKRIHDDASNVIMKNSGKIIYDKIMIDLSDS